MAFELGQTVGGYEFLSILDTSGAGLTYQVRNTIAQRLEILKLLPKELQQDRERVDRFLREAKIHARLNHPHIAAFYNAMEMEGQLVLTTELVEGTTLEQRLESGPLPYGDAIDYTLQALAALGYAHGESVIHRDLTPSNLIVTPDGNVKVTGFGLAKQTNDPRLTQPGVVIGSVYYMSPEQVKGSATIDARTDIYSLAVVLYEVVTGRKPFDSPTQFEVFMAHVNTPPPPPREVRPGLPSDLSWVILTSLAKDPAERFQSAQQFADALERARPPVDQPAPDEVAEPAPIAVQTQPEPHEEHAAVAEQVSEEATPAAVPEAAPEVLQPVAATPVETHASAAHEPDASAVEPAAGWQGESIAAGEPSHPGEPAGAASQPLGLTDPEVAHALQEPGAGAAALRESTPEQRDSWFYKESFPGWSSRDLIAVGTLTFVVVAALFFTLLTLVDR